MAYKESNKLFCSFSKRTLTSRFFFRKGKDFDVKGLAFTKKILPCNFLGILILRVPGIKKKRKKEKEK